MLAVIHQFHDGMQAFVLLDDAERSDTFDVGQSLRKRCVLAPLLFDLFFTVVTRAAEKRFLADAAMTDNKVQLQRIEICEKKALHAQAKSTGGWGRRGGSFGDCEVCCTRTMRASQRDSQKGWRG